MMDDDIKGYDLLRELIEKNDVFRRIFSENLGDKIRFFGQDEWSRIEGQNYIPLLLGVKTFGDIFRLGYNIGDCVGISSQLSYSYDDVDMVAGTVGFLVGTKNAEKEGGHRWLETPTSIIDTSLMLVIDKSLKETLGYKEEMRLTARQLAGNALYQSRKDFINDPNIRKSRESCK